MQVDTAPLGLENPPGLCLRCGINASDSDDPRYCEECLKSMWAEDAEEDRLYSELLESQEED